MTKLFSKHRSFKNLPAVLAMLPLLAACEHFPDLQADTKETGVRYQDTSMLSIPAQPTSVLRERFSNSSVEIYDFDNPDQRQADAAGEASQQQPAVSQMPHWTSPGGMKIDPRVTIYPIGQPDGYIYAPERPVAEPPAPVLRPPASMQSGQGQETSQISSPSTKTVITRQGAGLLGTVFFLHDETILDADDRAVVSAAASRLTAQPAPIQVVGYASQRADADDPVSRKMVNLRVAANRALAVSSFLMSEGVAPELIYTVARGEESGHGFFTGQAPDEETSRRVEIKLY